MLIQDSDTPKIAQSADEALLTEIRDNYRYASDYWREARNERKVDMRYLCGDPWDEKDRKERENAGRPCISHDELNQYVNECVNNARQNRRGIKVEPGGEGASEKTAEFRQDHIRAIEYKSKAQSVYLNAYQSEVEGGYGFCRVSRRYVSAESDEQEIVLKPIPNPDSVLYDPDCKEPDWSDAGWAFILDPLTKVAFKRRFGKAALQSFGSEEMRVAADWIGEKNILTAEYWRVEIEDTGRKTPGGRAIEQKRVVQYITNGIEILERNEQPGEEIPIPAFIGMERYVDDGSGPKRKLFSLVRIARNPQMSLAFLCSQQMEEASMSPKSPYVGYTGQFETDAEAWEELTKTPHPFVQVDPITDSSNGQTLPLPRREQFTPNFQAYEIAKDSCRRAVQAAMGINSLPTAAQRNNEKSGVALDKIAQQQEIGSYHFVDGYNRALERAGRIVNSWIDATYDTERVIAIRKADDKHQVVRANTAEPYTDEATGEQHHYVVEGGDQHDITLGTGPSYDSQREAASDFLDTLITNLPNLPVAPPQAAKLLALAIQMKQLGPKGDQMAEIISPDDQQQQLPPEAMQQVQTMQQHMQALTELNNKLQAELQKLQQEKDAKIIDNEYKLSLEQMKMEAQLAMAEVNTKAQRLNERIQFVEDVWKQLHSQAHDVGMQATEHQHASEQAAAIAAQQPDDAEEQPAEEAA